MKSNINSAQQAFADLVSIDAWHNETTDKKSTADLHVSLNFDSARVGGESNSPATFILSLKQAELILVIADSEPAGVLRNSVDRFDDAVEEKITDTSTRTKTSNASLFGETDFGPKGVKASAKGQAGAGIVKKSVRKKRSSYTVGNFVIDFHKDTDDNDRWIIRPSEKKKKLESTPWDAEERPIARFKDTRSDKNNGLPPSIRLEIYCRREDLLIDEITFHHKDGVTIKEKIERMSDKNKILAAESFIREKLAETGLGDHDLGNKYSRIPICSVAANINLEE